ncbi:phage major capsid protein, partial [Comamonas jiangduensis]
MSTQRKILTATFLGGLFVLAVFALAGAPLIPPDAWAALAAAGAMPMALTGETGGDVRKALEQLTETAKAAKATVEEVKAAHNHLDGRVAKIQEEMKGMGIDATTKAAYQEAVEKVALHEKSLDQLNLEVTELAKKAANLLGGGGDQRKSLGQIVADSEVCKSYKGGVAELGAMNASLFRKAAITSAAASAGTLIQPHR